MSWLALLFLLPALAVTGLLALAAFSVLYVNGVAPDRFEAEDLRRQTGPRLPAAKIGGGALLVGLLVLISAPLGLLQFDTSQVALAPADPWSLLRRGAGLIGALVLLLLWNRARGGAALLPWGGGKLSRPAFGFLALLPLLAVVVAINRILVEDLFGSEIAHELALGLNELDGGRFWLACAFLVLLAPLLEELLFRGAVFAAAGAEAARARRQAMLTAVLFSTAVFALLHPPQIWLPIGVLGLVLGCVRLHAHGVRDAILIHQAYNGLGLLLTTPVS